MIASPSQHPSSYRDPSGFVFVHDGKLYRQVNKSYQPHYEFLKSSGLYDQLIKKGQLIEHRESDENLTGDPAFYKLLIPRRLPFISYPYEWCFNQLKDAALLTLDIMQQAIDQGMILKDASAYNVQFYSGRPVFIDTLSFETYDERKPWIAYRQFCEQFFTPLALMHYLQFPVTNMLLSYPEGIPLTLAARILPFKSKLNLNTALHIHLQAKLSTGKKQSSRQASFSKQKLVNILSSLRSAIEKFYLDKPSGTWSGYYTEALDRPDYVQDKERLLEHWIDQLPDVRSAFDAGANEGLFSLLLSRKNIDTISGDSDHFSINEFYKAVKAKQEIHITPILVDLAQPTPAIGVNNRERQSLAERLQVHLVLALAVIHHLSIGRNITFRQIAEQFLQFGTYLIIEFVPKTDEKIIRMLSQKEDVYNWYTEETFLESFAARYDLMKRSAIGNSGRTLFLFKAKEPA